MDFDFDPDFSAEELTDLDGGIFEDVHWEGEDLNDNMIPDSLEADLDFDGINEDFDISDSSSDIFDDDFSDSFDSETDLDSFDEFLADTINDL